MAVWSSHTHETNGVRLHYLRTGGDRPPVVLLHGLMGSGACWTLLARALEQEFDVIMPDTRGHGDSSAPEHGYRYDDLASDVVGLLRGLGLARPVLIGHSMGGMTAAVVASRGGGLLRGLVLVDPTFLSPERQREVHGSDVAGQHRRALGLQKSELVAQARARLPHRSPEIIEIQAEARLKTSLAAFDVLTPPSPEYRAVVSAIDVPSLLVIGDNPVVTSEMAADLRDLNPRLRVEQIQNAGHGLPFEQPGRLGQVIASFLRGLPLEAFANRRGGLSPQGPHAPLPLFALFCGLNGRASAQLRGSRSSPSRRKRKALRIQVIAGVEGGRAQRWMRETSPRSAARKPPCCEPGAPEGVYPASGLQEGWIA